MTSPPITVREADDRDIDFLVGMNRMVHRLHRAAAPAYFREAEPGAVAEMFRSRLRQAETHVWIASAGEEPAGFAVAVLRERPANTLCSAQRFYDLEEIGVSPENRQKGVARALVEKVLAEARARGVLDVQLTSWAFNSEAHAAFKALGFRPMTVRFQRQCD
jgi:ribosomal protein S18 acetylase RimI-like enzyme